MDNRWKVLAIVFLARSGLGVQFQTLNSLGVELQAELAINLEQFGWLVGLFMLAGIFLSFPAGILGRFASDRHLIGIGLMLLSIGGLVGTIGTDYNLLAAGRVICGAGFVLGTLYFAKVINDWFDGKELATAMGILVMSWPIGIAGAQVLVPVFSNSFGWQFAFYASSAWCAVGAFVIAFILPSNPGTSTPEKTATTTTKQPVFTSNNWMLTTMAGLAWGTFNAGFVVYLSFVEIRFAEMGFSAFKGSWYASLASWLMPVAAITAGLWVDKSGARYRCIYFAAAGAIISMLILGYTNYALPGVLLFGLIGASSAGVIMSLTADAMPPSTRAFGMGIFFTIYFMVALPSAALAGWIGDLTGSAGNALAFGALLFLFTAISTVTFQRLSSRF